MKDLLLGVYVIVTTINLEISTLWFGRLRQRIPLKCVLHVQHDNFSSFKVTVDLQGCLPKNHSHARRLCYNHRKVYIIVKLIKFTIGRNNFFKNLI